jgi:hypothetical protein
MGQHLPFLEGLQITIDFYDQIFSIFDDSTANREGKFADIGDARIPRKPSEVDRHSGTLGFHKRAPCYQKFLGEQAAPFTATISEAIKQKLKMSNVFVH